MAELVNWPELERLDNPLDPDAAPLAPVEIRFQIKNSIQNEVTPAGRDGRVRGKDAGSARSSATCATEDDASCRSVRTRRPQLHFESSCKPGSGEVLSPELAAECSVAGHAASSPGAVLSFSEWEKDETPTLYCYTLARELHDGDEVKLRVHPLDKKHRKKSEVVWEKDFRARVEGDKFRLE